MATPIRRILFWFALFASLVLAVVVVNQTLQLAEFGARIHPRLGDAVFWGVVFILGFTLAVPLLLVFRLPRPLLPPPESEGPAFDEHLRRLRQRLRTNPRLAGHSLSDVAEIEAALAGLDAGSTTVIKQAGSRAFVTTAISQNGALDALIVLGIQARLVWDIAHIYQQRPTLRDLASLYSNVLVTAFIAVELDDADLAEALQPAVSAALGSVLTVIPGMGAIGMLATNAVLSGTGNAFLTLRVGIIAQEQSRALVRPSRRALRRLAIVRAGGMLTAITRDGGRKVASIIRQRAWEGAKGVAAVPGQALSSATGSMRDSVVRATDAMRGTVADATGRAGRSMEQILGRGRGKARNTEPMEDVGSGHPAEGEPGPTDPRSTDAAPPAPDSPGPGDR